MTPLQPMPNKSHVPIRTCVACRETEQKPTMTRLVRTPHDGIHIDPTGKRSGRGAYIHDRSKCWDRALTNESVIALALRTDVTDADLQRLLQFRLRITDRSLEVKA